MRPRSLAFALFLSAAIPVAAQDLTIIARATRDGGAPTTTVSYISEDRTRLMVGDGKEVIVDTRSGQMTTLDNKKKTYYVTTRQDMEELAAKLKQRMNSPEMRKAQEMMKNLPPEQRKSMEKMSAFDVQKTGSKHKIAGYNCEDWIITMGQMSRTQQCITSDLKIPTKSWDMYRGFADSMKGVMGSMAANMTAMQEQFKKMNGIPLSQATSTDIMGHKSVTSTEVTEVKRGPIPASAWAVPAGYTKVDNPMKKMLEK